MIAPGAVFEIPSRLANPPQVEEEPDAPERENRWVLVVSNKTDCRDRWHLTVNAVLLSAQTAYQSRHDVLLVRPNGGVARDSIAQTDLVFTILKAHLTEARFRGVVLADTLNQVRAKLAETLGFPGLEPRP